MPAHVFIHCSTLALGASMSIVHASQSLLHTFSCETKRWFHGMFSPLQHWTLILSCNRPHAVLPERTVIGRFVCIWSDIYSLPSIVRLALFACTRCEVLLSLYLMYMYVCQYVRCWYVPALMLSRQLSVHILYLANKGILIKDQ